jgi:superoxide dismutase, Fe-Mn family
MDAMTRRDVLGTAALTGLAALTATATAQTAPPPAAGDGPWSLPPLPYDYAALEPHISAQIMKLHHDVHHAAYVKGANEAFARLSEIRRTGGESIKAVRAATEALSFNLAGHALHVIFWNNMKPGGGGEPAAESEIARLIQRDFQTLDAFFGHFSAAAAQVQGNGWALLVFDPLSKGLLITQAEKHQVNVVAGAAPLLALDVWEHAYYLQYLNVRNDYIKSFRNVINWADVDARLRVAMKAAG